MFDYEKFTNKDFDKYQNYDPYNFNRQTRLVEKDYTINVNSLENNYFKDSSEYKAVFFNFFIFNSSF